MTRHALVALGAALGLAACDEPDAGPGTAIAADAAEATAGKDSASDAAPDAAAACTPGTNPADSWWNCAPKPLPSGGAHHGKACSQDAECLYGHCRFALPLAGYDPGVGVCTKNCKYPGGTYTSCNVDNKTLPDYECVFEKTANSGNDKRAADRVTNGRVLGVCAKYCTASDDCKAWNPALPDCLKSSSKYLSVGTKGVCGKVAP